MTRYAIGAAVALSLAAATLGARDGNADKKAADEAQKEVLAVVKMVEEGKDGEALAKQALAIKKKDVELNHLMHAYKLKEKGGLGYGEKADPKSGIEAKIIALQRTAKGPSVETLRKERKALIRLARVNIAMAEIARPHFLKPIDGRTKKDWDGSLDEQKQAAYDLIAAVENEDGPAVARAAKELLNACTNCHFVGRK
jgi:hypothetical protein